jgi:hypothetical protein
VRKAHKCNECERFWICPLTICTVGDGVCPPCGEYAIVDWEYADDFTEWVKEVREANGNG